MVFSSIPFIFFFLPLFFIIYYIIPTKYKNYVLLVFSLLFYAWGEPIYVFLMMFSCFVDYMNGRMYLKDNKHKTRYLLIAVSINLLLLGFFKYSDFIINILNSIFNSNINNLNLSLPIGISFYTFQTMSYSIDIYRGRVKPEKNYFNYLTYVSMFPQLIAGPIVRYSTINEELHHRVIKKQNFYNGFIKFLNGLFKKVLLANNIGFLYNLIINNLNDASILTLWLGAISFTLQIYFDFSGYSDMAIGIGKMLGFNFLENFNYPYISKSITDFWHRWHISLSTWFRDYVYIPLKGSHCSKFINIRNILIVWFLTGLWHGANYNYIIWGLYYAFFLILEKFILKKVLIKTPNYIKHIYTLLVVIIGWVIFAVEDMNTLSFYLKGMFGLSGLSFINNTFMFYFKQYFLILVISIIACLPLKINLKWLRPIIYIILFIISISFIISDSYNPFLYFRF